MTANPIPLVLVVESDPVQRDLMKMVLTRIGCEVVDTHDPKQVENIVSNQHPSLIILDTFIPGSSGLEIIKKLNQKWISRRTLVLFISSYGFPEIIKQAKDAGADEFLMKPIDVDVFSKRVRLLLKI